MKRNFIIGQLMLWTGLFLIVLMTACSIADGSQQYPKRLFVDSLTNGQKLDNSFLVYGHIDELDPLSNVMLYAVATTRGGTNNTNAAVMDGTNFSGVLTVPYAEIYNVWASGVDREGRYYQSRNYLVKCSPERSIALFDENGSNIMPEHSFSGEAYTNEQKGFFILSGKLINFISPENVTVYYQRDGSIVTNSVAAEIVNVNAFNAPVYPTERGIYSLWVESDDVNGQKVRSYTYKIKYIPVEHPEIWKVFVNTGITNERITNNALIDTIETNIDLTMAVRIKMPAGKSSSFIEGVYVSENSGEYLQVPDTEIFEETSNEVTYAVASNEMITTNNSANTFSIFVYDKDGYYSETNTFTNVRIAVKLMDDDTVFVSPGGNDENPGTATLPVKSIGKAVRLAKDYGMDNIKVGAGTYSMTADTESTNMIFDFTGLRMTGGWNTNNYTVRSSRSLIDFSPNPSGTVFDFGGVRNVIDGFAFTGASTVFDTVFSISGEQNVLSNVIFTNHSGPSVMEISGTGNRLKDASFINNTAGADGRVIEVGGTNNQLEVVMISNSASAGLYLSGDNNRITADITNHQIIPGSRGMEITGSGNIIKGSVFGSSGDGILLSGVNNTLDSVQMISNQLFGIYVEGGVNQLKNCEVKYNSLAGNLSAAVMISGTGSSNNVFENQLIQYNQSTGLILSNAGGSNSFQSGSFAYNSAASGAGGILIHSSYGNIFKNLSVIFNTNSSGKAGGINVGDATSILNCTVKSNKTTSSGESALLLSTAGENLYIKNNTLTGTTNSGTYGIYESTDVSGHVFTGNTFINSSLENYYFDSITNALNTVEQINTNGLTGANGGSGIASPANQVQ